MEIFPIDEWAYGRRDNCSRGVARELRSKTKPALGTFNISDNRFEKEW